MFVDSGPVLEKAFARNAGLGWIGKHTNLINRHAGSWFFLGEILTDLPLPVDAPATNHCGTCRACIDVCPTQAIVAPYDSTRRAASPISRSSCATPIPEEFRKAIGNRIYGCDDCQLVCPWNKFARMTSETDFTPRHGLDGAKLVELFAWTEARVSDAPKAARFAASVTNAGCATSPSRWAMRRRSTEVHRRAACAARTILQRWCASTCSGRWRSTRPAPARET